MGTKRILLRIMEDKWLLGKIIEIRGNLVSMDGCVFYLDSPYITTRPKSRFLLGTWEEETRCLIKKYLPKNLPVIEFGACIGIVSCLTNKLLVNPESHIVVEANKYLLPTLEVNRVKNDCKFKVINAAIAYGTSEITFYLNEAFNEGSTVHKTRQTITVPTITLQALLNQEGFSRINLICDVEGAEYSLVDTERKVIKNHVEWFFVESHGYVQDSSDKIRSNLEALGFCLIEEYDRNQVYHNQGVIE